MTEKHKKINPEKYCKYLTKGPEDRAYQNPDSFYICKITTEPCVARDINKSQSYSTYCVDRYNVTISDTVFDCPAHNISKNLAKLILEEHARKQSRKITRRVK